MQRKNRDTSDRAYEILAPVFLMIGVLVPITIQNAWAIGSGIFWLSAGSLAMWKQRGMLNANRKALDQELQADSGANKLAWTKRFECGNSYIDEQHQVLFKGFNILSDAIHRNRSKHYIDSLIDTLIDEVEAHFRSEETLLTDWKHPLAEKQRCLHENLLSEATQLRDDTQRGKLPYQCFLDFFADEIVYKHIDLEDRNYFYEI